MLVGLRYGLLNFYPKTLTFGFSECFSDWGPRSATVSREVEINDFVPQSTIAALSLTQQTGCFILFQWDGGGRCRRVFRLLELRTRQSDCTLSAAQCWPLVGSLTLTQP